MQNGQTNVIEQPKNPYYVSKHMPNSSNGTNTSVQHKVLKETRKYTRLENIFIYEYIHKLNIK